MTIEFNEWKHTLQSCTSSWGLELSEPQMYLCYQHCLEILRWNAQHNLTQITDLKSMLYLHILDSLSVAPWLNATAVVDIGSGAGFPGIPLAIAYPLKNFLLVEANQKKAAFLRHVVYQLKLNNCQISSNRIEKISPEILHKFANQQPFAFIARAFSKAHIIINSLPFTPKHTQVLLLKGQYPIDEVNALNLEEWEAEIFPLKIPDLNQTRHLIYLKKK